MVRRAQSVVQPRNRLRIIPSVPTRALDLEQIVEHPKLKISSRWWSVFTFLPFLP